MIRVNDKWDIAWREGMTVRDVLTLLEFTHHYLVISQNGIVVPPDVFDCHEVSDGDVLRVVHVISGG